MKRFLSVLLSAMLISCLFVTTADAAEVIAAPTTAAVIVNNEFKKFEAYNIEGSNYFKLRDIAFALLGTDKGFEVKWDESRDSIELIPETAYTPVGGEMEIKTQSPSVVQPATATAYLGGKALDLTAYNIGGNNYFKLRDILAVFDISVSWDAATGTIYIDSLLQKEITVSTVAEFIAAIGSNTLIRLNPGTYDFTAYNEVVPHVFVVSDVSNLSIVGAGADKTEFINSDRFKYILAFENCRNISISGVKAGHTPQEYECDAGVFHFIYCLDISVSDCYLYGCGSIGMYIYSSVNLSVDNTTITDCSLRAVYAYDSSNVVFNNCEIVKNRAYAAVISVGSNNKFTEVTFNQCNISENYNIAWSLIETWESYTSRKISLVFNDCTIDNNMRAEEGNPYMFRISGEGVVLNGCTVRNNVMGYEFSSQAPRYNDCEIIGNVYEAVG